MTDGEYPPVNPALELTTDPGRIIVLDIVGLRPDHLDQAPAIDDLIGPDSGVASRLRPPFPSLTVPAQTTLGTGQQPGSHGDVASGEYDRAVDTVEFWGRDRAGRTRLWEAASEDAGLTTGALFFQHLIGTTADIAVTPSPIEDENNDIIEMNCWTRPAGYYDDLVEKYDHFPLHHYWGPWANENSTQWIIDAALETITRFDPDLLWIYVPHLDYAGLRSGPDSKELTAAVRTVDGILEDFIAALRGTPRWDETLLNIVSEYSFRAVDQPIFPNRTLREEGLLETRADERHRTNVDLPRSGAFAMVDHQIAHVYAQPDAVSRAREALASLPGIETILDEQGKDAYGIAHPNAGDLVLIAEPDSWFQYYWWSSTDEAPGYAADIDIHAKPGFDPCELFPGDDGLVSTDPSRVGGSHGRVDDATFGVYGLGGPAAPTGSIEGPVDARAVAPTIAQLVGIRSELSGTFETASLLDR